MGTIHGCRKTRKAHIGRTQRRTWKVLEWPNDTHRETAQTAAATATEEQSCEQHRGAWWEANHWFCARNNNAVRNGVCSETRDKL